MGQVESSELSVRKNQDGAFVMVCNNLPEFLFVNPEESRLISFGIDKQTSPNYKHKTLSSVTVDDARKVRDSFVDFGVVSKNNAHLFAASQQTNSCTAQGMKQEFQRFASEVGENGLFLFHFSGHGVTVRSEEFGIAPADFDYSRETYVTADVLGSWLDEIKCVAKHIIFTLDCCYAGGIGKELTGDSMINRTSNMYVMSACMAHETSLVLGPLRNSVFTYFLSRAVRSHIGAEGLPIQDIFKECQTLCECLTATLVMYNEQTGLQIKTMTPQMAIRNLETQDFPDSANVGRFEYAVRLYNHKLPIDSLNPRSMDYLNSLLDMRDGPLFELEKRNLLRNEVLHTVLCTLMFSLASIEVACDSSSLAKVKNPNLSITAFMQVSSTVDMIHNGLDIPENVFFLCWLYYKEVMATHKVKLSGLEHLQARLLRTSRFNIPLTKRTSSMAATPVAATPAPRGDNVTDSAIGEDFTDSAGGKDCTDSAGGKDCSDSGKDCADSAEEECSSGAEDCTDSAEPSTDGLINQFLMMSRHLPDEDHSVRD